MQLLHNLHNCHEKFSAATLYSDTGCDEFEHERFLFALACIAAGKALRLFG